MCHFYPFYFVDLCVIVVVGAEEKRKISHRFKIQTERRERDNDGYIDLICRWD